jgi:hypothetical protein
MHHPRAAGCRGYSWDQDHHQVFLCLDGNQMEEHDAGKQKQLKQLTRQDEDQDEEQRAGSQAIQRMLQETPASFNYLHSLVLNTW